MKKLPVILALGLLYAIQLTAQENITTNSPYAIESPLGSTWKKDSARVVFLAGTFWSTIFSQPDLAIFMAREQLALSRKWKLIYAEYLSLANLGYGLYQQGNYLEGLKYEFEALAIAEAQKDNTSIANMHNGISEIYRDAGDLAGSMEHLYFARKLIEPLDSGMLQEWYVHTVPVYEKLNLLDSALDYAWREMALDIQLTGGINRTVILYYLGNIYSKKGNFDSSLYYYHQAIRYSKEKNIQKDLVEIYNSLSRFYVRRSNYDSSLRYAALAQETEKQMNFPLGKLETSRILSGLFLKINKLDSANKYLMLSIVTQDSIFSQEKLRRIAGLGFEEQMRKDKELIRQEHLIGEYRKYTLLGAVLVFVLIVSILIRSNLHKQKAFRVLQHQKEQTETQKEKTEKALTELRAVQTQLIQSEKMASLGEMAAGVAHEIQNPLNFVKNFSEVNSDLMNEMEAELKLGNVQNACLLACDIRTNLEKIGQHSERADSIVKGMVLHSRSSKGQKEDANLNVLVNQYLKLSFTGIRSKDKTFPCEIKTDFESTIGQVQVITQDFGRLLMNLFNNAFYTLAEKRKKFGEAFIPQLLVKTRNLNEMIEISVCDNGMGMPGEIIDKIFQPFFTTKPPGRGTGLGLSLSYEIIKAHGGEIKVNSEVDKGSEFKVILPVSS